MAKIAPIPIQIYSSIDEPQKNKRLGGRHQSSRFYAIALGSLRECQAILEIEDIENTQIKELSDEIGAILFKLSKKR